MRMHFRYVLVLGVTVLLAVASWQVARGAGQNGNQQGGAPAAPDFSLAAYSGGRSVSLADVRGKVVLLYFFFPT